MNPTPHQMARQPRLATRWLQYSPCMTLVLLLAAACHAAGPAEKKHWRIAIVGAGPAGLTAAETLAERGYQSVTVFERNAAAGGKVLSRPVDGGVAELGAVIAPPEFHTVVALADKYGVEYVVNSTIHQIMDADGGRSSPPTFFGNHHEEHQMASAVANYYAAAALYEPWIRAASHGWIPPDLTLPFSQFSDKYGFSPLADVARGAIVGSGYGYYETAPALYMMRAMEVGFDVGGPGWVQQSNFYIFPRGYQSLWQEVARHHDVRFNAQVTRIVRSNTAQGPVTITINQDQPLVFDAVIISASLNHVGRFMDLTPEESELFSQVESLRYVTSQFATSGLRTQEYVTVYPNAFPDKMDQLGAFMHAKTAPDTWVAWQLARPDTPADQLVAALGQGVALGGGTVQGDVFQQEWDYFPHVGPEALRSGFYERIRVMQGANRTYYVGATLSFETVEHAARQAADLVKRHFPRVK